MGNQDPGLVTVPVEHHEIFRWISDAVSGETTTCTYGTAGRLTQAAVTGGPNARTYSHGYDVAGNRTSSSVTGT